MGDQELDQELAEYDTGEKDGMCAYERLREARKKRNAAVLESLGLGTSLLETIGATKNKKAISRKRPKTKSVENIPFHKYPLRSRNSSTHTDSTPQATECVPSIPYPEPTPVECYDSNVLKYLCIEQPTLYPSSLAPPEGGTIKGFAVVPGCKVLRDEKLTRIYSMNFLQTQSGGEIIVAGGHQGRVAIWGGDSLLSSFRAHQGWVSDVQWLSETAAPSVSQNILLTSGNDQSIVLWDTNKVSGYSPPAVFKLKTPGTCFTCFFSPVRWRVLAA